MQTPLLVLYCVVLLVLCTYGVHRATVVRWLAAAREALFAGTRARMRDRLRDTEIDEVLDLIQSRLDVSVRRLLASMESR